MYFSPCSRQPESSMMPMQQYQYPMQPPLFPAPPIGNQLPTGIPSGPTPAQISVPALPVGMESGAAPQTVQNINYTPAFLRTQIGRKMRVEFLIGTGALLDRTGTLIGVGASYILLRPVDSDDIMMCDLYSIKFVTVFL